MILGLPRGRRPAWPEIEDPPQRRQGPGTPHPGGGRGFRGYLTIFTINNRQRAEPEERGGVPHVLERHLGGPPGLMKIFKLR